MKEEKKEWKITTNRFVVYIDIMGFKDMVSRNTNETIYQLMQRIYESIKFNEGIDWLDAEENFITSTMYSDSIILYSKDDSYESCYGIICSVSSLMVDLFNEEIPFKGAISFGQMTLDNEKSIFFGQPLIDAYILQDEIAFYGIVFHSSAEQVLNKYSSKKTFVFTINYLTYFKSGRAHHLTIHPIFSGKLNPKSKDYKSDLIEKRRLKNSINKLRNKTSGSLRRYIDNTEEYLAFVDKIK